MTPRALALLRCPRCGDALVPEGETLRSGCGAGFPVAGGIPRFAAAAAGRESREQRRTRRAFELEWKYFGEEERIYGGTLEESMDLLFDEIGQPAVNAGWVAGKRVLDAGCGHGRYVAGLAGLGGEAVGLDLGLGIEVAARRCRDTGALLAQGSLLEPPLAPSAFDLVISKGVIHCTPDPRGAVRALARLVRPGGFLYVWVYPRYPRWFLTSQEAIRQLTKRMPPSLLLPLCFAAAPLLGMVVRRGVGVRTHASDPRRSLQRTSWRQRAQMIYDWYAPWYQTYHTTEEVMGWLGENGFVDLRPSSIPTGASGRRADG